MIAPMSCLVCGNTRFTHVFTATDTLVSRDNFEIVRCTSCGFYLTNNTPSQEEINRFYGSDNYISHTGGSKTPADILYNLARSIMLRVKSRSVISLTEKNSGRLLDIGAGTGHFVRTMRNAGWQAEGVEVNETARVNAQIINDVKLFSSLNDIPSGGLFDAITLWHVLEHIHDPNTLIRKLHESLTDNGVLIIAVPNADSADSIYYREMWAALDVPRHLWHFNMSTLTTLLGRHGFVNFKVKRMPFDSFYIPILSEKNRRSRLAMVAGMIKGLMFWFRSVIRIRNSSSLTFCFRKVKS